MEWRADACGEARHRRKEDREDVPEAFGSGTQGNAELRSAGSLRESADDQCNQRCSDRYHDRDLELERQLGAPAGNRGNVER